MSLAESVHIINGVSCVDTYYIIHTVLFTLRNRTRLKRYVEVTATFNVIFVKHIQSHISISLIVE